MERMLYRLENAFIMILAFYVFLIYGTTWTGFILFLTLPKWLKLLPNGWKSKDSFARFHRMVSSLLHSYSSVLVVAALTFLFANVALWSILGWVIHIAADRVIRYKEKNGSHPYFQARG